MKTGEIWTGILIPLMVGPLFIYLKSVYDNYNKNKREHNLELYNLKCNYLKEILNNFYWPLYIKLLCISKLNYNVPLKNDYEYISESDNDDDENNVVINIDVLNLNELVLDKETINLMEENINQLFKEALDIIELNIYLVKPCEELNQNLIEFIKFCKIRLIIHENSINKKYNIRYFNVKDNTNDLLILLKKNLEYFQDKYFTLLEKGPFKK